MAEKEAPKQTQATLRSTPEVARNALRALGIVYTVDRPLLFALLACQLSDAFVNVGMAWVAKRLVDAAVLAQQAPANARDELLRTAFWWLFVEFLLGFLKAITAALNAYFGVVMRSEVGLHVNLLVLEKAANVSYRHFEDATFINRMSQARREATARPVEMITQLLSLLRQGATLLGCVALLWPLGPLSLVLLVCAGVPPFLAEAAHGRAVFELQRARTQRNRQAFYLEQVLTTEATAKEVKLFGLARWLIDRYRTVHLGFHEEEVRLHQLREKRFIFLGLLSLLALYIASGRVVYAAATGVFSLGAMTLYLAALRQGQTALQWLLNACARIYENNLFMSNLFEFLSIENDEPDEPLPPDYRLEKPPEVRLEHVSFRYPDTTQDVLADVSLVLRPGETLALVGKNGAGKTTLVKLLTGLYRPTGGKILIDGVDAATMSAPALRRRVGAILQDFARYQFSAKDNVGVGWLPLREDAQAVETAVQQAGAEKVVARLPKGLDTTLGRAFDGDDLSGGQWQLLALARAFMRRGGILLLDEPAAALDAETEYELFQRFQQLKEGCSAVLITHRFSTVRMADRIVVLEHGRVIEEGTHKALVELNGRYAQLYRLQAEGYRDD